MIKAVLFDLGGVLTQNREDCLGPREILKVDPEVWQKAGLGLIDDEVAFQDMAKNYNVDSQTIKKWLFSKRAPNREVFDLIAKLNSGIKKGIISNSLKTVFYNFMDQYNLNDKFDAMTISAEEHIRKPDKEIFLAACKRLDIEPSDCLFIDNDLEHIESAKKIGMAGLLFANSEDLGEAFKKFDII